MNWEWIRALGDAYAAPYEIAAHPLGDSRCKVWSEWYYASRERRFTLRPARGGGYRVDLPDTGPDEPSRPMPQMPSNSGILALESNLLGRIFDSPGTRPFTPVVLVDGVPVATGFGRGYIAMRTGEHLVEIQAGGSAGYRSVVTDLNGFAALSSYASQHLAAGLQCSPLLRQMPLTPTNLKLPRLPYLFTLWTGALGFAAGATLGIWAVVANGLWTWLAVAAMFGVGGVGAYVVYKLARGLEAAVLNLSEQLALRRYRPAAFTPRTIPGGSWRPVDPFDRAPASRSSGAAVLRLTLTYEQVPHRIVARAPDSPPPIDMRRRIDDDRRDRKNFKVPKLDPATYGERRAKLQHQLADDVQRLKEQTTIKEDPKVAEKRAEKRVKQFGEDYPPAVRPWVARPVVTVDGAPVPAIWGVNEYRFPPGPHRITVAVPPPPEILVGDATDVVLPEAANIETHLWEDRPVAYDAHARIEMTSDAEGQELARYSAELRLEPASS